MKKENPRSRDGRVVLIYVHDPMCSWCWAFGRSLDHLLGLLPEYVSLQRLLGGLAPDSDVPMDAPMRAYLQATWRRIEMQVPGTRFNFDFWRLNTPYRQTWPACRAVIAARTLDRESEEDMIGAIQRAYYEQARDPSDPQVLSSLAAEIGLARDRFEALCARPETQVTLNAEMSRAHALDAHGFPSLRLVVSDAVWPVAVDYRDATVMQKTIDGLLTAG